jgi:hypothetical protein
MALRGHLAFVQDQIGGALSSAAVLRVGLWPTAPPLCRYAKCAADLILQVWWVLDCLCRHCVSGVMGCAAVSTSVRVQCYAHIDCILKGKPW